MATKLGKISALVSGMRTNRTGKGSIIRLLENKGPKFNNSNLFNYATTEKTVSKTLSNWQRYSHEELKTLGIQTPLNGFEEMIRLTEEGKLWKFPIDNEQGMEAEQNVPFEDHIFLDQLIDSRFPKNDFVRSFMDIVISGTAKNHWITVERKRDVIAFFAQYFSERKDLYSKSGIDLDYDEITNSMKEGKRKKKKNSSEDRIDSPS